MKNLLLLGAILVSLTWSVPAEAATLYLEPSVDQVKQGDSFSVLVRLDTDEDECVNVVDGVINFPTTLEAIDTSRGSSIMSVWVEDPIINKAAGTITFAGGIPNGYCGRIPGDPRLSNIILELLFRAPIQGTDEATSTAAVISFASGTRVLLNDGFGTDAALQLFDTEVSLLAETGGDNATEWNQRIAADQQPPQRFSITLESTRSAFSGKYYIVFNTTDKESGLDHYEVMEEPLDDRHLFTWGAETAPWITARSPYVLKDQTLNSTIRVKAVDKAGNEYIAVLVPDESQRTMTIESRILIALLGTMFIALFISGLLWVWLRRRPNNHTERASLVDNPPRYE